MGLSGFAAGVDDALQRILAERRAAFLQNEQLRLQQEAAERQQKQFDARMSMDRDQLGVQQMNTAADQAYREGQAKRQDERQARADQASAADAQQFEALIQSLPEHARPVVQLRRRGVTGVDEHTLETPEAHRAHLAEEQAAADQRELGTYEAKKKIDLRHRPPSAESSEQTWVIRNGEVTPIRKGTAQPGDKPYDAVAARQAPPPDSAEARSITESALAQARRLRTHEGIDAATGAYEMRGFTQPARNFNSIRNQLVSALAYPNLGALRGPLSDKDILFLKQLSTRLSDTKIDRAETEQAIDEAITFLESKLAGDIPAAAVQEVGGRGRVYYDASGNPVRGR